LEPAPGCAPGTPPWARGAGPRATIAPGVPRPDVCAQRPAHAIRRDARGLDREGARKNRMSGKSAFFTAHPMQQFRRSRRFYLRSDSFYAALAAALIAAKIGLGLPALLGSPTLVWLVVFPAALYAVVLAHLTIHNAVHGNFPRAVNRLLGEVLGFIVVVRFA